MSNLDIEINGYLYDGSIDPAGEEKYIRDDAELLTKETISQLMMYNANWYGQQGFRVHARIVESIPKECDDIVSLANKIREESELNSVDGLVVVDAETGSYITNAGADCIINETPASLLLKGGTEGLNENILDFYGYLNAYLTTGTIFGVAPDDYIGIGDAVPDRFTVYLSAMGYAVFDVTSMNTEIYPDSTVIQASNGHITLYCMNGNYDDSLALWFHYYEKCLNNSEAGTFWQAWDVEDTNKPYSVEGVVDGCFTRAELIGTTCVVAQTEDRNLSGTIGTIMAGIGIPENLYTIT